jgi:hypothetical protein
VTIRTFIISGDDEGEHHSNGTEAYLSLPHNSVPDEITEYAGDIWLKNPQIIGYTPLEVLDHNGLFLQVTDPTWAARGLWQTLLGLIQTKDVYDLVQANAPETLDNIQQILALTHDVSNYEPPTIQEEAS